MKATEICTLRNSSAQRKKMDGRHETAARLTGKNKVLTHPGVSYHQLLVHRERRSQSEVLVLVNYCLLCLKFPEKTSNWTSLTALNRAYVRKIWCWSKCQFPTQTAEIQVNSSSAIILNHLYCPVHFFNLYF